MYGTILLMLTTVTARITDYSHSNYIPVTDGDVLVWRDYDFLHHTTNLTEFTRMADETERLTEMFPQSHMRKLLEVDTGHVRDLLAALSVHHRLARSLDFLGTTLKVVAGTPDAHDLENIRITEARLKDSNS